MKALTTTIAALLIATSANAESCRSAHSRAMAMLDDVKVSIEQAQEVSKEEMDKNGAQVIRAIMRRVDSLDSSLISVRVYCHDNLSAIRWANEADDLVDRLRSAR